MLAACFTVCGREKYSGHSPPLLFSPANGAQEPQKVEGLLIPSLSETSHGTAQWIQMQHKLSVATEKQTGYQRFASLL